MTNALETETMRARCAAAWGVDVDAIKSADLDWADAGRGYTTAFADVTFQWRPETQALLIDNPVEPHGFADVLVEPTANDGVFVTGNLGTGRGARMVARFLFCMGYDVQFLIDAGVTVTATDKIEWACQMRDAGFPLEAI